MAASTTNFRSSFCSRTPCAESSFERTLFRKGLYRHAVPVAALIRWLAPRFFRDDDELIRHLATDVTLAEIDEDIDRFEYGNRVRRSWLRTGLKLHLNPGRIGALARQVLTP